MQLMETPMEYRGEEPDDFDFAAWFEATGGTWPQYLQALADRQIEIELGPLEVAALEAA